MNNRLKPIKKKTFQITRHGITVTLKGYIMNIIRIVHITDANQGTCFNYLPLHVIVSV